MRYGKIRKTSTTPDGKLVQAVEKFDDEGKLISFAVVVDGEEVESFGNFDDANEYAEGIITPRPKS